MRLAFTGDRNRPGKKDFTGAFYPEAKKFTDQVFTVPLDRTPEYKRDLVVARIRAVRPSSVGFFCHGLTRKMELGFDTGTVNELASALADVGCSKVSLYCCSTGGGKGLGGDGGFADELRDAMCRHGLITCRVLAHTTSAHTTMNPFKRVFDGLGSSVGGTGGQWVVKPGSELWKVWRRRLKEDAAFRLSLADKGVGRIHYELQYPGQPGAYSE